MAQYWLQTPIENAKEVVQRFIDDNIALLPYLANKKVEYTTSCEVIYYSGQIPDQPYLADEILFGTWYIPKYESSMLCLISDSSGSLATLDCQLGVDSGAYPYVIWNYLTSLPETQSYFVGYKFSLI
jgi:hypothetical protein